MSVILLILKIIGILLLSTLGLFLLAVCLALLVPMRYAISGELKDAAEIHIKISWLLHLVVWRSDYANREYRNVLKIFGISRRSRSAPSEPQEDVDESREANTKDAAAEMKASDAASGATQSIEDDAGEDDMAGTKRERPRMGGRFERFFTDTKSRLCSLKNKLFDIKSILVDETNKAVVVSILTELKYLFRHFRFRTMDADLNFSLGDPAMTGQALGLLAVMPFLYRYRFNVYPDFVAEEAYVSGTFKIQGQAHGLHVLTSFLRLWRRTEFRDLVRKNQRR